MKKIYYCLFVIVLLLIFNSSAFSQSNYISLGNLGTTSFCATGTLSVPFTTNMVAGTIFKVYLSDASGSFNYQTEIGNGTVSPIEANFSYISSGTGYLIKVVSVNPSISSQTSSSHSNNGQSLNISVKNLFGREIGENGSQTICQGSALTGVITSNQSGGVYEWKKDGVSLATSPTFRMTQSGNYSVSLKKAGCSIASKAFNLLVRQSHDNNIFRVGEPLQCIGGSIIFKSQYFSDSASYQWKKNGAIIMGETKDTLFTNQSGTYEVGMFDKCTVNSVNKNEVQFSNTIENNPSFLGLEKSEAILCKNAYSIPLYGKPNNVNPLFPYSFQWKKDGIDIPNQNNFLLTTNTEGVYSLALSQGSCTSISKGIFIPKLDSIKLALRVTYPYTDEICQGMSVQIQGVNPNAVITNLYKNGVFYRQLFTYTTLTEAGKYTISSPQQSCKIIPSDTIKITVGNNLKTTIAVNTTDLCIGKSTQIQVWNTYSQLNNVAYQWYKNAQPIQNSNFNYFSVN